MPESTTIMYNALGSFYQTYTIAYLVLLTNPLAVFPSTKVTSPTACLELPKDSHYGNTTCAVFKGGIQNLKNCQNPDCPETGRLEKKIEKTCKGHDTVVSLSAGDDTRPVEA